MDDLWERAFGARCQTAQIEGQTFAQQLKPLLLSGPMRLGHRGAIEIGIMADADPLPLSGEGPDRKSIGPFALRKQQMQLSVMSALRL